MRRLLLGLVAPLALASLVASTELAAQTRVQRYDVTKETDYGIVYRLPETQLSFVLDVREQHYQPGSLAAYADKYLGRKVEAEPRRDPAVPHRLRPQDGSALRPAHRQGHHLQHQRLRGAPRGPGAADPPDASPLGAAARPDRPCPAPRIQPGRHPRQPRRDRGELSLRAA